MASPLCRNVLLPVCAIALSFAAPAFSQTPARTALAPSVVAAVDRLYPGFTEVIEEADTIRIARLARTLRANPSADSLTVLLWMLRHCPSWSTDEESAVLQIGDVARAVGRLPLTPLSGVLLNDDADQRIAAMAVLGSNINLIAEEDKEALQGIFIDALSDPNIHVREFAARPLRDFHSTQSDAALGQLLAGPNVTDMLFWLATGRERAVVSGRVENVAGLSIDELAVSLNSEDPDSRLRAAQECVSRYRAPRRSPPPAAERLITALTGRLSDPIVDVRMHAADALGYTKATRAAVPLVSTLEGRDVTKSYASVVMRALMTIGSRDVLPALERLAHSARPLPIREEAVFAFVMIAKPADAAAEGRRLLWERPDTNVERAVMARGRSALPLAWQALASGSRSERRAAAALLGWFPDPGSILPILTVLSGAPGALTREQLLFDLNMILLTDGTPAGSADQASLAAEHLRWLYDELTTGRIDSDMRSAVLSQNVIAVFPDRVAAPFSVALSSGRSSAMATRVDSPEAFRGQVAKDGVGVAFHAMTVSGEVARVATTLYLPRGRVANQVWISLYRRTGSRWLPLQQSPHPFAHRMQNEPNVSPAFNRDYGSGHPLKVLRLDLTMEHIRVDLATRRDLAFENLDVPGRSGELDRSYVPLLEKYKRSDSQSVRLAAEFESARLTAQPDVQVWVEALAQEAGTPAQAMALEAIGNFAATQIKTDDPEAVGRERAELIAAALAPDAVDARLLPRPLPKKNNIRQVQRAGQFGAVSVQFGSGDGAGGYTMFFARRGTRWTFLCNVRGWIS